MTSNRVSYSVAVAAAATTLISLTFVALRRPKTKDTHNDESLRPYPPTPPNRHWLWGHALCLRPDPNAPKQSHDLLFLEWNKKLKSKVVMFQIPMLGRFIVVSDATVARYVLMGNFRKSPTYKTLLPLIGRKSMVATEGETWASQRRLYNPGFNPAFLRGCVKTILEKCNRFVTRCDDDIENGLATNMLSRAVDLTSDVLAQLAFGEDWGVCNERNDGLETLQTIRELTVAVGENMSNPLLRYFGFKQRWKTWRLSRALERSMQRLVRRRLESMGDSLRDRPDERDILSLTLSSVLKSNHLTNPQNVSFSSDDLENMTSQLKTFYFAGHDTTATTIAWAFWLLVQHPLVLQRARQEVVTHIGKEWEIQAREGNELSETTYDALHKCEYLDAIARETLRLYPPAASTRFVTDSQASAGGYRLGNAIVHINFYAIQRDPGVWEDADSFIPERFLGEEGKRMIASSSFLPFSKGMRDCIGKYFALLETKIALAVLISRYDANIVDDVEIYASRLTSIPMGGCKVELRHRM
ncbi:hypothetical protein HJC23_009767 [Cyclotella cryptica]|uniref:Cytochrome P450 n=1 Tax=Cyclotella cryptica TaxID=29204 RepID=A0ABD3PS12_9STRA